MSLSPVSTLRVTIGAAAVVGLLSPVAAPPLAAASPAARAVDAPRVAESISARELDFPDYGASALATNDLPPVVGSAGTTDPLPMASITKVVTALVVLDRRPLHSDSAGPRIRMTSADVALYDRYLARNGTVLDVREGWRFTQRELLELSLVPSANNYAGSLARWASGSERAFARAATDWLQRNGLASTTVVEPTGLDAANRGTATDVVRLGQLALANPVVRDIVAMTRIDTANLPPVESTNELLGTEGIDGIKTGTLDTSNLLFSAVRSVDGADRRVVGVILGAPDADSLDADVVALLRSAD